MQVRSYGELVHLQRYGLGGLGDDAGWGTVNYEPAADTSTDWGTILGRVVKGVTDAVVHIAPAVINRPSGTSATTALIDAISNGTALTPRPLVPPPPPSLLPGISNTTLAVGGVGLLLLVLLLKGKRR